MGGVPLLLMAAVMGITFGWQPNGDGGVDCIIQIPPDQLDQVRRSGSVQTEIPPQIRGRVSRVIVQVGDGPLKQISSGEIVQSRDQGVTDKENRSDGARLPIPEIRADKSRLTFAMKPDVNDPGQSPGQNPGQSPGQSPGLSRCRPRLGAPQPARATGSAMRCRT